jgi:hypothetical protein
MSSNRLNQLFEIPVANRDEAWELDFLRELALAPIRIVNETAVAGPDGWPYLMISTDLKGDDGEALINVARWLSTRGMGFVVNPEKAMPDYVMSYGMVWNFRERGEFLTAVEGGGRAGASAKTFEIKHGQQLFTGAPSLAYLPEDIRVIVREFLKRQKVVAPKTLMISADQKSWDLAFSIESMGNPPVAEHAGIAEALSWFLPAHYLVALVSEKHVAGFSPL